MKSHENNAIYCVFERLAHHKSAKFAINSHEKLCLRSKHDFWCLKAPKLWKGYPKVVPTGHLQVTILGPKGGLGVHTVYELILKAHRWSGKCQKWRLWLPPGVPFRYLCVCVLFSNWTILNKWNQDINLLFENNASSKISPVPETRKKPEWVW